MKKLLYCLLSILSTSTLFAQSINMPTTGVEYLTTSSCILYDNGGAASNYGSNCNATYVIETQNQGAFFSINGSYDLEQYYKSRLVIYDGGSTSTSVIGTYSNGIGAINICTHSSEITIRFFSDTDTPQSGFVLNIVENTCPRVSSLTVIDITESSAKLTWGAINGSTNWIIECTTNNMPNGQNIFSTTSNFYELNGLNPLTNYCFRIHSNCTPITSCSYSQVCFSTICPCPQATYAHATLGDRTLTVEWIEPHTDIVWTITLTYNGQSIVVTSTEPIYIFDNLPFDFEYYTIVITSDCYPYNLICNQTAFSYNPPPPQPPPPFECLCPYARHPIVSNIQSNSVDISWDYNSNAIGWILQYKAENSSIWLFDTVFTNNCTLNNLEPITNYECYIHSYCDNFDNRCKVYSPFFTYSDQCFNFLDLKGPNCHASYGTFYNPFQNTGIINYGSASLMSRHTIMRDTIEKDPRTNNMLSCVPPGEKASVRLGNWNIGAESESIDYMLYVDTNNFDLLLLKYAIVLQDPNHPIGKQPRFILSLWDDQGRVIDETCGYINFYSGQASGWNRDEANNVLWKDWSTMGLDLTNYHGRRIYIKLSTYDCEEGGHYGYAYYTLSCGSKYETRKTCGKIDSILMEAPTGFYYSWYLEDDPDNIISTQQELRVLVDNSVFYCKCTSVENELCYFYIKYIAERNYPYSLFDYNIDSCSKEVAFFNQSIVSNNDSIAIGDKHCSDVKWLFHNGTESILDTAIFTYDTLGVFPVILISSLNNGDCLDTLIKNVEISPYYRDTIRIRICEKETYNSNGFNDSIEGVYSINHITERGCDSLVVLDLKVQDNYNQSIFDTLCKGSIYSNYGFNCYNSGVYTNNLQSIYGCDSIITLYLTQIQTYPDYSIIDDKYILVEDFPIIIDVTSNDCNSYFWNTGSTSPILEVNYPGSFYVTLYTVCGNVLDSVYIAVPDVNVFVPNSFTPLLDNNNTFFPVFESSEKLIIETFEIFNRWGQRIYASTKTPWDGKYKGKLVDNGVYIWRLIYRTKYSSDRSFEKTGDLNVIR
ncbi:MAG: fibronectin type III domain-containing protein [Bacteroidales bacterium]|nr:fibronectin type III domain-containing protein [Bacteroidales bacterium]